MGKKLKREQKREERVTEYANKIIGKRERKLGRKLTEEEIVEAFQRSERREEKRIKRNRKIVAILTALGIGGIALLNSGEKPEPEPEPPSGQETDIDDEKDNEKPKTDREKWLEGLQVTDTIDSILQEYNDNLPEEEKINKNDLGIILRENIGEGHVIQVTSGNGEISYVENPLLSGILPEGQEWVEGQDINDEYILVDTENNSTVAGMGTIDNMKTEIDVQYANFGGQEYVKNDETYVGLPEGVDLEEAYEDFSNYYQFRLQQQEKQQEEQQKDTQQIDDYEIEP